MRKLNTCSALSGFFVPDLSNNKVMKRNYTHRNSGKLCVEILWYSYDDSHDASKELLEVKNLVTGRVVPGMIKEQNRRDSIYFKLDHLDAGEYEITARFGKARYPRGIYLCKGKCEFFSTFFALFNLFTQFFLLINSVHGHCFSAILRRFPRLPIETMLILYGP
jgi:hypothetical protein